MSPTPDVLSTFDREVKSRHDEMLAELESINVDDLQKSQGLTISLGGKTFKFTDLEITNQEDTEEKLRLEFKEKLNTQQQRIRDKINAKINQLLLMHQNKQQEFDRKEKQLRKKFEQAALMPDINQSHMLRGLSVVKGNSNDELCWIFRAKYNPRFILLVENAGRDKKRKALPSRLVNRMKKDIIIVLTTKGKRITSVATKHSSDSGDLVSFPHYHQQGDGDCWGNWSHPSDWKTPDDILRVAKDAEAILETINHGSLANRGPAGLPRIDTIMRNVADVEPMTEATTIERQGGNDTDDDVWQAV